MSVAVARWLYVLALGLCFMAGPAGVSASPVPSSLAVDAMERALPLGHAMQILEDPGGQMDLDAVRHSSGWQAQSSDVFTFGFSRSVWWARVVLRNDGLSAVTRMLEIGTPLQDEVDFYFVPVSGASTIHVATGDRRPFATRTVPTVVPATSLRIEPYEALEVYLRLGTHDGLHEATAPRLWRVDDYMSHLQGENLAAGVYYGALVTLLVYNLFLFFSTRQSTFGFYALYVAAFLTWSLAFRGYAFQYLWPSSPEFGNQMLPVSVAACFSTFVAFMSAYLETRQHMSSRMHRTLVLLTVTNALCALPALIGFYALPFALSICVCLALMGFSLFVGTSMAIAGSRPARYMALSFTILALSVMLYYLALTGLLPPVGVVEDLPLIGSILEVLLLAFGLADQMNTLKAGKLKAEQQALAAQTALTTGLEREVAQRTAALAAANQRLADMAITDELTGAFNRRHFNAVLAATMARHARIRTPVAFCMVDVDHFKQYNDRYGHPAGDLVLQAVSRVVRERLARAGDHFFRIGGEEFGILMDGADTLSATRPFVEQVRAAIEALALPHAGSPHGVVTASFGLVLLETGDHPIRGEELVARADQLLYDAKHAGRNRVVSEVL